MMKDKTERTAFYYAQDEVVKKMMKEYEAYYRIKHPVQPEEAKVEKKDVISFINEQLECHICLNQIKEPLLTKCGHSFCGVCIKLSLKNKKQCPLCN